MSVSGRRGDPAASREAVLKLLDAEHPLLRIFYGEGPLEISTEDYESRLATWREWKPVSIAAHGGAAATSESRNGCRQT